VPTRDQSGEKLEEHEPNEALVTLEFHPRGSQTELVLRHEEFASAKTRDRYRRGWNGSLDKFEKLFDR
jgi:Activator of Hsp90 ATPase homolog 1-like protein